MISLFVFFFYSVFILNSSIISLSLSLLTLKNFFTFSLCLSISPFEALHISSLPSMYLFFSRLYLSPVSLFLSLSLSISFSLSSWQILSGLFTTILSVDRTLMAVKKGGEMIVTILQNFMAKLFWQKSDLASWKFFWDIWEEISDCCASHRSQKKFLGIIWSWVAHFVKKQENYFHTF